MRKVTLPARQEGIYSTAIAAQHTVPLMMMSATLFTVAIASGVVTGFDAPNAWALPATAVFVFAAEMALLAPTLRAREWVLAPFELVLAAGLALAPGGWLTLAVTAGALATRLTRCTDRVKVSFNVSTMAAAAGIASLVATRVGNPWWGPILGVAAGWLVWTASQAAAHLTINGRLPALFSYYMRAHAYQVAVNVSLGLVVAHAAMTSLPFAVCVLLSLVALTSNFIQRRRKQDEENLFADLLRSQHSRERATIVDVGHSLLLGVEALIDRPDVQARVFLHPRGRRWQAIAREGADAIVSKPTGEQPHAELVAAALSEGGARVVSSPFQSTFWAVIGTVEEPSAVITATWPGLTRWRDRVHIERLGVALARGGESWLVEAQDRARTARQGRVEPTPAPAPEVADDALSALDDLREAAQRLMALSTDPDRIDTDALANQVQSASAAVACLHGAVASSSHTAPPTARRWTAASRSAHPRRKVRVGQMHEADA